MTVQPRDGMRAATPRLLRLSPSMYSSETGVSLLDAREAATSGTALMFVACATRAFLSGSPWATSSPFGAMTIA